MTDDLLKKHEGWNDEDFKKAYGTQWEAMKAQDTFMRLPKEDQEAIRKVEIQRWENQKNGMAKIKVYADMEEVQRRFVGVLANDRDARAYIESVVIAVSSDPQLQQCNPRSIMYQALRAASLRLSVDKSLHQAHLVRYGEECQLIVDYHGLVQMSEDTGYYSIPPNVSPIYEGEDVKIDRFSGQVKIEGEKKSSTVIGWCGYFKAKNGSERWLYMTNDECDSHGKKYNPKGFASPKSAWSTDKEKMRRKTVLRQLVLRWGHFTPYIEKVMLSGDVIGIEQSELPPAEAIAIIPSQKIDERDVMAELGYAQQ
ncbi:MAG: recombinase RecT [Anaerolineales bacterium]|nr:recombinase RecT [Anaerolineales bacterium]